MYFGYIKEQTIISISSDSSINKIAKNTKCVMC